MVKAAPLLNYIVFILRGNPVHFGHKAVIDDALTKAEKVILLFGSQNRPISFRFPFSREQRESMIEAIYKDTPESDRIWTAGIDDYASNDSWVIGVQNVVDALVEADGNDPDAVTIGLTGNDKDSSTFYLNLFPQWERITPPFIPSIEGFGDLDATHARKILFHPGVSLDLDLVDAIPGPVIKWLKEFRETDQYKKLAAEYDYIQKYKKSWEAAPYAPTFVTVDAVVFQSGHVLVIRRRAEPGKGLMALPGGFLNQDERIVDGMIRELREETKVKVPDPVLKGSIKGWFPADDPNRSARGRTISHVACIRLAPGPLPRVKGSDDAEKAFWLPLKDLKCQDFFEDHWFLIQRMLEMYPS